jgi:hypothetical protein
LGIDPPIVGMDFWQDDSWNRRPTLCLGDCVPRLGRTPRFRHKAFEFSVDGIDLLLQCSPCFSKAGAIVRFKECGSRHG